MIMTMTTVKTPTASAATVLLILPRKCCNPRYFRHRNNMSIAWILLFGYLHVFCKQEAKYNLKDKSYSTSPNFVRIHATVGRSYIMQPKHRMPYLSKYRIQMTLMNSRYK